MRKAFVTDKLREGNVGGSRWPFFPKACWGGGASSMAGSAMHPGPLVIVGR